MLCYPCPFEMCPIRDDCPMNRRMDISQYSEPDDDTGVYRYFASCPETGETVCDLEKAQLAEVVCPKDSQSATSCEAGTIIPGAAYREFVTCCNEVKQVIKMKIRQSNGETAAAPFAAEIADKVAERPKTIGDTPVDEFWTRFNKEKNKAKIGAPSADDHAANYYTAKEVAAMFGPPCNEEKVGNWESRARGSKRGATPPSAMYKGRLESYREELRKFPIGENLEILTEIIKQYKATEGVKAAAGKLDTIHCRSEETLAKASGAVAEAQRERSQLKNSKE